MQCCSCSSDTNWRARPAPAHPTQTKLTLPAPYFELAAHASRVSAQGQHPPHPVKRWMTVGTAANAARETVPAPCLSARESGQSSVGTRPPLLPEHLPACSRSSISAFLRRSSEWGSSARRLPQSAWHDTRPARSLSLPFVILRIPPGAHRQGRNRI